MQIYNHLKNKYSDKLIQNSGKNYKQFYKLMSSKRKMKNNFPLVMVNNRIKYTSNIRYQLLSNQLKSNFQKPTISFSMAQYLSHQQLSENATIDNTGIWETYTNEFLLLEIIEAINNLDDKKVQNQWTFNQKF